jgi:hypothetical protein
MERAGFSSQETRLFAFIQHCLMNGNLLCILLTILFLKGVELAKLLIPYTLFF